MTINKRLMIAITPRGGQRVLLSTEPSEATGYPMEVIEPLDNPGIGRFLRCELAHGVILVEPPYPPPP